MNWLLFCQLLLLVVSVESANLEWKKRQPPLHECPASVMEVMLGAATNASTCVARTHYPLNAPIDPPTEDQMDGICSVPECRNVISKALEWTGTACRIPNSNNMRLDIDLLMRIDLYCQSPLYRYQPPVCTKWKVLNAVNDPNANLCIPATKTTGIFDPKLYTEAGIQTFCNAPECKLFLQSAISNLRIQWHRRAEFDCWMRERQRQQVSFQLTDPVEMRLYADFVHYFRDECDFRSGAAPIRITKFP